MENGAMDANSLFDRLIGARTHTDTHTHTHTHLRGTRPKCTRGNAEGKRMYWH